MTTLLLLDLLGARDYWRHGDAEAAFARFHQLVLESARGLDVAAELQGELEGDRVALFCPTPFAALALGRRIFRRAFLDPRTPEDGRLWLRGVVLDGQDETEVRATNPVPGLPGIRQQRFAGPLAEALAALHSGFRGMRLLVADALLTDSLRGAFRIPLGRLGVIPFRKLNHSPYPATVQRTFQDCLWMAESQQEWGLYESRMTLRMLWSARNPQEFAQAGATQGVFHECLLILKSVARKASWREDEHFEAGDDEVREGDERRP